ncbi:MAG: hypothetical protein JWS10_2737 [Cypionkella sp.]|uniref:peroxidase family protein n=1 Tax=Cypionkella sp. TaxID=2811411 RepID=UPI0026346046|nr:peroxidase family protein [Cypionkella sp.]MDB5660122.1 hypothetical protein [Cypionkella sp.]
MNDLACLHGAGYRLVIGQLSPETTMTRQADLFGPDGVINTAEEPIVLDVVETERGMVAVIGDRAAAQLDGLLVALRNSQLDAEFSAEAVNSVPVRVYSRIASLGIQADDAMLDRLGRLGDALLVDYGFAPPPPLPRLMGETPAAYTYLGQFLAHEMTVWKQAGVETAPYPSVALDSSIDLKTIFLRPLDFPPKLPGHVQEVQGLALGETIPDSKTVPAASELNDLPRMADGRALLFERRNDQNLALSQTHVAVTRFAQAALAILQGDGLQDKRVRRTIIRHFQSVVLQDFLPRLIDQETYDDVMNEGRVYIAPSNKLHPLYQFFVPIEVSAAIFRFGHAMVREVYAPWNTVDPKHTVPSALATDLLDFTFDGENLTNGQLLQLWTTDWRHMLGLEGSDPIKAARIGTELSQDLFCLPDRLFQQSIYDRPCAQQVQRHLNLARRTLMTGALLKLPTGQALAEQVQQKLTLAGSPCHIPILAPDLLDIPDNPAATEIMREGAIGARFVDQTPLWLYILREAAICGDGNHLGPLGGRMVAETLSAAIEASGTGMIVNGVRQRFVPDPAFGGRFKDKFDYCDLVRLAFSAPH